jgi:hypothetical protein
MPRELAASVLPALGSWRPESKQVIVLVNLVPRSLTSTVDDPSREAEVSTIVFIGVRDHEVLRLGCEIWFCRKLRVNLFETPCITAIVTDYLLEKTSRKSSMANGRNWCPGVVLWPFAWIVYHFHTSHGFVGLIFVKGHSGGRVRGSASNVI